MATDNTTPKQYIIFREGGVPLQLISSVDLIGQWMDEMIAREEKPSKIPILFFDEEGEASIAIVAEEIKVIVRGAPPVPETAPAPPHMPQRDTP